MTGNDNNFFFNNNQANGNPTQPTQKDVASQAQTFKNLADYYSKNGQDKLIQDILANVRAQKARGTLDDEQLRRFAKTVSPMLSATQREKLEELLKQLMD